MYRNKIIQGDTLTILKTLPESIVDMCITSPPYWGLRDYGVPGQLGLEPTIDEYISNMTVIFQEVRRVLKDTGTLWLNMGDAYAGSGKGIGSNHGKAVYDDTNITKTDWTKTGLKPKDLIGQPWRLAFSLQAAGWYLRSDIIWHKPNPMPESVTDRPTKSHEYIFLLTKKAKYFYDAEAIKESLKESSIKRAQYGWNGTMEFIDGKEMRNQPDPTERMGDRWSPVLGRNKRTVWTIATQSYSGAHFATFPEKLVEPCIRAGTSEWGNCAECGKPWVRVVKKTGGTLGKGWTNHKRDNEEGLSQEGCSGLGNKKDDNGQGYITKTLGWEPSCSCDTKETVSPIILDPFMGSGTVGLVAKKLNRDYLGIELNPKYIKMAEKRLYNKMALFV